MYTAISINSGRLGLQKPDLVLCSDNQAFVIDITIVSDQVSVDQAHRQKVEYYNQSHISEWVSRVTGATDVGYLWDIGEALCPSSVGQWCEFEAILYHAQNRKAISYFFVGTVSSVLSFST